MTTTTTTRPVTEAANRSTATRTSGKGSSRWMVKVGGALAGVLLIGLAVALAMNGGAGANATARSLEGKSPLVAVARGPLTISVDEAGTIRPSESVVVKSEVEGRVRIISLVPEGKFIEKGDLLVELDSATLQDTKIDQEIQVQNAEAAFIKARETLAVAQNLAASEVDTAELNYRFAVVDLNKYLQGDYPQELQQAEADITIAVEEQKRAAEKLKWSHELAAEGFITQTELEADELASKKAQLDLELAQRKKYVLETFTFDRKKQELESAVEQMRMALERAKRKAVADVVDAEADLRAKEQQHKREQHKLDKVTAQIEKCRIYAPCDGMVVYANDEDRRRGDSEPLAEGVEVFERQALIRLPTATEMSADVKIHESAMEKVREGLPVLVRSDALPGRVFRGTVAKIALLPDSQSRWLNPDLKVYNAEIALQDSENSGMRPGMSCRAEIIIQQFADAMYLPVQCVVQVGGQAMVYSLGPDGQPIAHPVKVGMDNNRMVQILEGVGEGELYMLAPPLPQSMRSEENRPKIDGLEIPPPPAATPSGPPRQGPPQGPGATGGNGPRPNADGPSRPRSGGSAGEAPRGPRPAGAPRNNS